MIIKKVLIVSKKTALNHYQQTWKVKGKKLERILKKRKINFTELVKKDRIHYNSLEKVGKILESLNIEYYIVLKHKFCANHLKEIDLVISVGGDGTFLETANLICRKKPIWGINSNPKHSLGIFCSANTKDFKKKLMAIEADHHKIKPFSRIEMTIDNGKKIKELALNEVFIASTKPQMTSKYKMKTDEGKEMQYSSGLIVSTGAGSTGWMKAAGGKIFDVSSHLMEYYARDLIRSRILPGKLKKGFSTKIVINSKMFDGMLVVDSAKQYGFNEGARATLKIAKDPLRVIWF